MQKTITFLLITLLIINLLYVLSEVLFQPIISMDVIGIWLFKAKAIFLGKDYFFRQLSSPEFSYSSQDYPILLPLSFSLIFELAGGIKEKFVLLLYPLLYSLILFLTYKSFRTKASVNISLLFTYLFSMFSPLLAQAGRSHAGNADIVLVFLASLALYLLLAFPKSPKLLFYLTLVAMTASQIKMEGVFLVLLLLFLPLGKKQKMMFIFLSLIPFFVWTFIVKVLIKIPFTRFYLPPLPEIFFRSKIIIFGLFKEILNIKNWYIFWPIFALGFFIKEKASNLIKKVIFPFLVGNSILFFIIFIFSSTPTEKYVPSSIGRILLQLSPWFFLIFFENTLPEVMKLKKRFSQFL